MNIETVLWIVVLGTGLTVGGTAGYTYKAHTFHVAEMNLQRRKRNFEARRVNWERARLYELDDWEWSTLTETTSLTSRCNPRSDQSLGLQPSLPG